MNREKCVHKNANEKDWESIEWNLFFPLIKCATTELHKINRECFKHLCNEAKNGSCFVTSRVKAA